MNVNCYNKCQNETAMLESNMADNRHYATKIFWSSFRETLQWKTQTITIRVNADICSFHLCKWQLQNLRYLLGVRPSQLPTETAPSQNEPILFARSAKCPASSIAVLEKVHLPVGLSSCPSPLTPGQAALPNENQVPLLTSSFGSHYNFYLEQVALPHKWRQI